MTDELILLDESATTAMKRAGKRWLVTLATPGVGSKGTYSEDMLKTTGPVAVPAGTKSFFKHAKSEDRDPRDQVGVFEEGAFWNDDEGKLQAYLTPFPRYESVLEEAGKSIEASLHVQARKDIKGNITALTFRRDNTVDLVAFGGLEGSGLEYQVVESLFAAAAADGEDGKEKNDMTFEITKEVWESLTSRLTALDAKFDTFVAESMNEKQGKADEAKVAELVETRVEEALASMVETVKSIDDAELPVEVKESLKTLAHTGEDISESLAAAVSIVAATKKELAPAPKGAKSEKRATLVVAAESLSSEDAPKNFKVGRWTGATK